MTLSIPHNRHMVRIRALLGSLCLLLFSTQALAFECVDDSLNARGADDGGDTSNTACGPSATVTGDSSMGSTAVGATAKANFMGTALGNLAQSGSSATAVGQLAGANLNSVAVGKEAVAGAASKDSSVALGMESLATGGGSIALGRRAEANADHSIAIGAAVPSVGFPPAKATEVQSIALGTGALASGFHSIAIGGDSVDADKLGAEATHTRSIAIGPDAKAAANFGSAWGWNAVATGDSSTAVGSNTTAGDDDTTTLGANAAVLSPHINATAIGARAFAGQSNSMILGPVPGVNDPPLDTNNYVDVGIGTTTPAAPLHIQRTTSGVQEMFRFTNTGGSFITWEKESTNAKWFFTHEDAAGGRLIMDHQFNDTANGPEFALSPDGNLEIKGTLTELSDENAKQDIAELEGKYVLARLEQVPVSQWAYKASPESKHIGPMAQDFHAAFGLGKDDKHISPRDMAGVNMAAIKAQQDKIRALENANTEKDVEIAALKEEKDAEIAELKAGLKQALQAIEIMKVRFEAMEARHPMVQASSR